MNNTIVPKGNDFEVQGERFDNEDPFSLDDDTPLACPLKPADNEGPCGACQ